jgi:hypothetical protein
MTNFIPPRLRRPLLLALTGAIFAVAFVGLSAAIAVRGSFWWPFAVMIGITLLGYLFGLSNYGVGAQDPADEEAGAEDGAPVPVSP